MLRCPTLTGPSKLVGQKFWSVERGTVENQVIGLRVCSSCGSGHIGQFDSEIGIHVPGIENLDVPTVFVFPRLVICKVCGAVQQFTVPHDELTTLLNGTLKQQHL